MTDRSSEYIRENEEYRRGSFGSGGGREADEFFIGSLLEDEYIIWSGSRIKGARLGELGVQFGMVIFAWIYIIIGVGTSGYMFATVGLMGFLATPFTIFGVGLLRSFYGFRRHSYALTNMRLLEYDGSAVLPADLEEVLSVEYKESRRGIGCVICALDRKGPKGGIVKVLQGIKAPSVTAELIKTEVRKRISDRR